MNPYPAQRTALAVETLSGLLTDGGMTVLLVEHDMEVVFSLANKITVLHRGLAQSKPPLGKGFRGFDCIMIKPVS